MKSLKSKSIHYFNLMILNKCVISFCLLILVAFHLSESIARQQTPGSAISLPKPDVSHGISLNSALNLRRSQRKFSAKPISLTQLSQLLWSAQGVTHFFGFRTAPSAGALYPLEIFVVVSNVDQLSQGIYHYKPDSHELELIIKGDHSKQFSQAANRQSSIKKATATLIITAVIKRTEQKYGQRAKRYVHIEAGSAAQNIYLQAASLQLGTVYIGSFKDKKVLQLMQLPMDHKPLGLMPVGHLP